MTFKDMIGIDPEILEAMRKMPKLKPLMQTFDYLDDEQRRREEIFYELTNEEIDNLEMIEEFERIQFIDEQELDEYEEELNHLLEPLEKKLELEKENSKVFVKSLNKKKL